MNNEEIKEILDNLTDIIFNTDWKKLLDYITNLQQIEKDHQKLNGELREENDELKSRCEKAIDSINITMELIQQQPTNDDTWILARLNGFKYLLQGGDKE